MTKSFSQISNELNQRKQALPFSFLAQEMGSEVPAHLPSGMPTQMTNANVNGDITKKVIIVTATVMQNYEAIYVAWEGSAPNVLDSTDRHFFLGFKFHSDIQITNLPLVGDATDAFFGFKAPSLLISSEPLSKELSLKLTQFITAEEVRLNTSLPQAQKRTFMKPPVAGTSGRVGIGFGLEIGGEIAVFIETQPPDQANNSGAGEKDKQTANVQKKVGPLSLDSIRFQFKDDMLWAKVTGSFNRMGLKLKLLDFGIGFDFAHGLERHFRLGGIEVGYQSPGLQIGGGLYGTLSPLDLTGEILVHSGSLSLIGMGAYKPDPVSNEPSFFAFIFLGAPLIGEPPVLVTGLAAGVGFNRALNFPDTTQLLRFPLIQSALALADPTKTDPFAGNNPMHDLEVMKQYIPVKMGESWLAVGLDFTISEVISGFAMMSISFGVDFAVDILGVAEIIQPKGVSRDKAVAAIDLAVHAHFAPTSGEISLRADITPQSFILSQQAHLTGGLALQAWYGSSPHAGEWVVTLGGYSPLYQKPKYYPIVKPLGLNWRLSGNTVIKGGLYFALTPAAVMAGGYLEAIWQRGSIRAWFNLHADFLISWHPFHYDISAGVQIGATFTVTIIWTIHVTAHIGADLHLWGPDFSGSAHVDLSLISFTVNFGASASPNTAALSWDQFKEQFVPVKKTKSKQVMSSSAVCDINLQQGLIKVPKSSGLDWVVDPEHLIIKASSYFPSKTTQNSNLVSRIDGTAGMNTTFGIGPMKLDSGQFTSELRIDITSEGGSSFVAEAILGSVPAAIWDKDAKQTPMGDGALIQNTVVGYMVTPERGNPQIHSLTIDSAYLLDNDYQDISFNYTAPFRPTQGTLQGQTVSNSVNSAVASSNRPHLLAALAQYVSTPLNVSLHRFETYDAFLTPPRMCLLGG